MSRAGKKLGEGVILLREAWFWLRIGIGHRLFRVEITLLVP